MADDSAGEKTQDATPHRRQQARDDGHVVQSHDLNSAALLLTCLSVLLYFGGSLTDFLMRMVAEHLGGTPWLQIDTPFLQGHFLRLIEGLATQLLPLLGVIVVAATALCLFQTGFVFVPEKVLPDLARLDPLAGLQRLFSLPNGVRLAMGMLKVIIIVAVAYWAIYKHREAIVAMTGLEIPLIGKYAVEVAVWTCIKIGIALLILAILDYAFQWWKFEQDIRMTPQEMREEMRNLQGDPQVIARRRSAQRQLAVSRLKSTVPKADVVITNPTELAIAIQYDYETMAAPIVIAKGAGVIAQRIRRLALENGVPIVEKKPLAQALYRDVDLNHPIPDQMYAAVAEVLAYVYQLKGKPLPGAAAK